MNELPRMFGPEMHERWTAVIERRIRALLAPGLERGQMDFIEDFAIPLPILIISELVGVPEADRERVKRWCDDFSIVALNFYANISNEQLARGLRSLTDFRAYLVAFTILLTELRTLELLPVELRHRENFNMRCYQTLPIRLSA